VREEREVLEDVAGAARADGEVEAARRVEERLAVDADEARVRAFQPGDGFERERLARARRAEEDGDARLGREVDVEREARGRAALAPRRLRGARELFVDSDREHRYLWPAAVRRLVA
jgi:hypothetical protein